MNRLPILFFSFTLLLNGQNRIGTGAVEELYQQHCMSCHGENLHGGLGNSLIDQSEWKEVGQRVNFIEYVQNGNSETGMPVSL